VNAPVLRECESGQKTVEAGLRVLARIIARQVLTDQALAAAMPGPGAALADALTKVGSHGDNTRRAARMTSAEHAGLTHFGVTP
jgi:hypothetical protein